MVCPTREFLVNFNIKHMYTFIEKDVDANLDAPDNAISGNEPSSEMLTSQSQKPE